MVFYFPTMNLAKVCLWEIGLTEDSSSCFICVHACIQKTHYGPNISFRQLSVCLHFRSLNHRTGLSQIWKGGYSKLGDHAVLISIQKYTLPACLQVSLVLSPPTHEYDVLLRFLFFAYQLFIDEMLLIIIKIGDCPKSICWPAKTHEALQPLVHATPYVVYRNNGGVVKWFLASLFTMVWAFRGLSLHLINFVLNNPLTFWF